MYCSLHKVLHFSIVISCLSVVNINAATTNTSAAKNSSETTLEKPKTNLNPAVVAIEGGAINSSVDLQHTPTHQGREHVVSEDHMIKVQNFSNNTSSLRPNQPVAATSSTKRPIDEFVVPEKNDNKHVVPKKGAPPIKDEPQSEEVVNDLDNYSSSSSSTTPTSTTTTSTSTTTTKITTTTRKSRRKKPLLTEASEVPLPSSNSDQKSQYSDTSKESQISSLDMLTQEKKHHKTDFVVPIVAVILSVPFVAILISVLYKRGTEWWQHRHYRRMDFLIEGMYNN